MVPGAILESIELAELIPARYSRYRGVLVDALAFFLRRLSPARVTEILAQQSTLPPDAGPAERLVALMHACPTLHKIGQVVARHRSLDLGFRRQLQTLEQREPRTPLELVRPLIEAELQGAAQEFEIHIEPPALAEASVAVVIPFSWSPAGHARRRGVFKVLRPGIEAKLDEELAILADLATYLDGRRDRGDVPAFAYRETFDSVERLLRSEVQLVHEQDNLAAANRRYRGDPRVHVPELLPFSSPRLTAMERLEGAPVDQVAEQAPEERRQFAETLVAALIGDVVLSRDDSAFFHADPHAGNLLRTVDGRLGILDWSLVGRLDIHVREALVHLVLAGLTLDRSGMQRALRTMISRPPARHAYAGALNGALRQVRRGRLPGPSWALELMDQLAENGAVFPADLLLLRKVWLMVEGVAADISPRCVPDAVLVAAALRALGGEWSRRMGAGWRSREFKTHVSNADLVRLATAGPSTVWKWWTQEAADWARRLSGANR